MDANDPAKPTLPPAALYDIEELAALGGVSRRTVRFYVQRGLLPAPLGTGRGKHYGQPHLERLVWIRGRQESGANLDHLEAEVTGRRVLPVPAALETVIWTRIVVAEGVELHLRGTWPEPDKLARIVLALRAEFVWSSVAP